MMTHRGIRLFGLSLPLALAGFAAWAGVLHPAPAAFDHAVHLRLFPGSCMTCHQGAAETGAPIWPRPASCSACHDGEVEARIEWAPPVVSPASNLRFAHPDHRQATADSVNCTSCHTLGTGSREVSRRLVEQCISCHAPGSEHLLVPDRQCATCHLPLAEATTLSRGDVADFPVPAYHAQEGFSLGGHGTRAAVRTAAGASTVAASCATCHARDFCLNCHVNAPEVPAIQALAPDQRSLVHRANFMAPPSHAEINFLATHGPDARRNQPTCAACHAQPSCTTCHIAPVPRQVAGLAEPGPGRATGASTTRHPPPSHTSEFREGHGGAAAAAPRTCSTCHVRDDCLSCHRPVGAATTAGGDYHPAGFLARHPAATYARQTACGDCHNAQQFCATCHAQAGLSAGRALGRSTFHDGRASFILGHGQAARQSLESCVSCHVERDCTACHSSVGRGFRFNPHGPGFDPERLRRRNPEMCIACHGRAIPGAG
jgi:hypothetical protein